MGADSAARTAVERAAVQHGRQRVPAHLVVVHNDRGLCRAAVSKAGAATAHAPPFAAHSRCHRLKVYES